MIKVIAVFLSVAFFSRLYVHIEKFMHRKKMWDIYPEAHDPEYTRKRLKLRALKILLYGTCLAVCIIYIVIM